MKLLKRILVGSLAIAMTIGTTSITQVFAAQPMVTIITEPLWDDMSDISDGLIKVQNGVHSEYTWEGVVYQDFKGTDGGFIDESGKNVLKIKQHHEYMDEYKKNNPEYESYTKSINNGEMKASEFSIDELRDFHEGRAFISLSQQYAVANANMASSDSLEGFIDKNNKLVIEMYDSAESNNINPWSDPLMPNDYKEGISTMWGMDAGEGSQSGLYSLDLNGKSIGLPYRNQAEYMCFNDVFGEGLLGVGQGEIDEETGFANPTSMGYVDKSGKQVIDTSKFKSTNPFQDGLALVEDHKGLMGIIDKTGNYIIQPQFTDVIRNNSYDSKIFHEDRGAFKKDGKWGIVDKKGKVISDFTWGAVGNYSNGLCIVKKDNKFGYVDLNGKVVIQPQFDEGNAFVDGVTLVKTNNIYKIIDKTGKQVGTKTWDYDNVESMSATGRPDLIKYQKNNKWGLAKIAGNK